MEINLISAQSTLTDDFDFISKGERINISLKDLRKDQQSLGQGSYGTVFKVKHDKSDHMFAVKIIRMIQNSASKDILKELNIPRGGQSCPFIIDCYGAMRSGGDIWICMELMSTSLDKLYEKLEEYLPEEFLIYIMFSVVSALWYLHRQLQVMHRDVKPSNVLIDERGRVKLCDFGTSGFLVDSIVRTKTGTQYYLSPERIDFRQAAMPYDIKADVWSLGLTVLEVALRRFPYKKWPSIVAQLNDVVYKDVPTLPADAPYSQEFRSLLYKCLVKDKSLRLNYDELLNDDLLKRFEDDNFFQVTQLNFGDYVFKILII